MVSVVNAFLSYVMVMLVIAVVAGVAITIGITLRKRKDKKLADGETTVQIPEENE